MKYRNLLVVFLLSLVTFGIYGIFWLYKTRQEMTRALGNPKSIPPVTWLFVPALGLILVTPLLLFFHTVAILNILGALIGIGAVLGLIAVPFWWFRKYCDTVARLTGSMSWGLLYVLWLILTLSGLSFAWMLIVQNELNKLARRGYGPGENPAPGYPQTAGSAFPQQTAQPWQQPVHQAYTPPPPFPAPQHPAQPPQPAIGPTPPGAPHPPYHAPGSSADQQPPSRPPTNPPQ